MSTQDRNRKPAGITTGGQFATQAKAETGVSLVPSPKEWRADTVEEAFGELTERPRPDQRPSVDVKASVAAMRSDLRTLFKHKFSVTMATGSAYGWARIGWDDGPRVGAVDTVANGFCSSRFDGMDDSYHQVNEESPVRWGLRGVNTSRGIGAAGQRHIDAIFDKAGLTGYRRMDHATGERSTYDGGYEGNDALTEDQVAAVERALGRPIPGRHNMPWNTASHLAHVIQAYTTYDDKGAGTTDFDLY